MDIPYLHDFHAAIEAIKASQHDVVEMVTKWAELFNGDAKDVTFRFANGDEKTIPNLEKVLATINQRTLPPRPTFTSITVGEGVRTTSQYGESNLTNSGLSFAAHVGGDLDPRMAYNANGLGGPALVIGESNREAVVNTFPFYRYFNVNVANASISFKFSGNDVIPNMPYYEDFYVYVENGASVRLHGMGPSHPVRELSNPGVYHMICEYKYIYRLYVSVTFRQLGYSDGT